MLDWNPGSAEGSNERHGGKPPRAEMKEAAVRASPWLAWRAEVALSASPLGFIAHVAATIFVFGSQSAVRAWAGCWERRVSSRRALILLAPLLILLGFAARCLEMEKHTRLALALPYPALSRKARCDGPEEGRGGGERAVLQASRRPASRRFFAAELDGRTLLLLQDRTTPKLMTGQKISMRQHAATDAARARRKAITEHHVR
jgi:hypothetical protein